MLEDRQHPLFPVEPVQMTLADLKRVAVDAFPGAWARENIWSGFERLIVELESAGLSADVYVDGSFVTDKRSPDDIDLFVMILTRGITMHRSGRETLYRLRADTTDWKRRWRCDLDLVVDEELPDPAAAVANALNLFAWNAYGDPKRAVLIRLRAPR